MTAPNVKLNRRSENLMMFAGKEVTLLTILYKKHSLAILRSALKVVSQVIGDTQQTSSYSRVSEQTFEPIPVPLGL